MANRLPGWLQGEDVNAIIDLWENPCGIDWWLYAELAKPAAHKAVMTLLEFDLCDILRCIYRPANLPFKSKRRPGRRGKGRIPGPLGIPEALCERFLRDEDAARRPVSNGARAMWRVDGLLQKGLFYYMIAETTSQFLIDWSSLIQSSSACRLNLPGWASGTATPGPGASGGGWSNVAFPENNAGGTCGWVGNAGVSCTGGKISAGGYLLAKPGPFTPEGATYETRLVKDNVVLWQTGPQAYDPKKPNEGHVIPPVKFDGASPGGVVVALQVKMNSGIFEWFDILDGGLTVSDITSPPAFEPWQPPSPNDVLCFPTLFGG